MSDYEFVMPWPPSVNNWKSPFKSRMILTKKGREYRQKGIDRLDELGLSNEAIGSPVSVKIVLNPPSNRRYDIDNFCKSLFDVMSVAGFWVDDSQIVELSIKKGVKTDGGNVEVTVNILDD